MVLARTSFLALAAVAMLGLPGDAGAQPERNGRVVTIERPHMQARDPVRLCVQQRSHAGTEMVCLGEPRPQVGKALHLIDFQDGYQGEARVTEVGEPQSFPCQSDQLTRVEYEMVRGTKLPGSVMMFAFMGTRVSPGARIVPDPHIKVRTGQTDGQIGVDRGSGRVDLLITVRQCDLNRPPGQRGDGQCFGYWFLEGGSWRMDREDAIYGCR